MQIIRWKYMRLHIPPEGSGHYVAAMNQVGQDQWEAWALERSQDGGLIIHFKKPDFGTYRPMLQDISPLEFERLVQNEWFTEQEEDDEHE